MPLIIAADNLNILNPAVAQALDALDPQPLQELARRCEQAGANLIDINPGFLPPRRHDRMAFMVEAVQQVTSLRLILDSPDARVLARGLAVAHQPPILNACTLEPDKLREILPLAAAHQTDLVLLLLDARSFPAAGLEGKITLALELRDARPGRGLNRCPVDFRPGPPQPHLARRLGAGGRSRQDRAPVASAANSGGAGPDHGGALQPEERAAPHLPRASGRGLPGPAGRRRARIALVDVLQPGLMETVRVINQAV